MQWGLKTQHIRCYRVSATLMINLSWDALKFCQITDVTSSQCKHQRLADTTMYLIQISWSIWCWVGSLISSSSMQLDILNVLDKTTHPPPPECCLCQQSLFLQRPVKMWESQHCTSEYIGEPSFSGHWCQYCPWNLQICNLQKTINFFTLIMPWQSST
jgi:hypothetical protein